MGKSPRASGERLGAALTMALDSVRDERQGRVASYIPELAKADPELLAIAVCAPEGNVHSVGRADFEFTLQSVSKPFVYGSALARFGAEAVHARAGTEPTGEAFDAVLRLDNETHRAHNPMINVGALATTALYAGSTPGKAIRQLLADLSAWAGRDLQVDVPVFLSERGSGHRNRAIAHLLHHVDIVKEPVDEVLDLYFQQCSVLVSCRDLTVMAATLAGGGRNPLTGQQVIAPHQVPSVLSIMFTCGLYDYAGRFAFDVGLPAKSGVSGAVVAVAPTELGLAAVSPLLDEHGNSIRAVAALRQLSDELDLHLFTSRRGGKRRRDPQSELEATLHQALSEAREITSGAIVTYSEPLARIDPNRLAMAACAVDGEELAVGDADIAFTLQAAANPFTYATVADLVGRDAVHAKVGVEPSGNPYDAIVFNPRTARPFNPLYNAGAIAVCSLMPGADATERLSHLLRTFAAAASEPRLYIDAEVLEAERTTGELNRAIASLLRAFGLLEDEATALELYFQQCSIRVTCRQLARIGATLAAGGVAPDGKQVFSDATTRDTVSLMATCGLHNESGAFAFEVGLPAKSGISGALVAVVPGRMGLAVYAPPVNRRGTSVRGLAALRSLAQHLGLGVFGDVRSA